MRTRESEYVEELCEEIWSLTEAGSNTLQKVVGGSKLSHAAAVLNELRERDLARETGGRVVLTDAGSEVARTIVRRHRLAEVLFHEVLALDEGVTESTACEVEHVLSAQVTDSICTYLGHPPRCPHGKPIPQGGCCQAFRRELRPLVAPLPDLGVGASGRIVFITASSQATLERIGSLGVVPGRDVRLVQCRPSVVLEAGHTRIALDPEIAAQIFVRRNGS
jgi:DtxR family transcriptional regulator, Mn-dependent transcriptional regulator